MRAPGLLRRRVAQPPDWRAIKRSPLDLRGRAESRLDGQPRGQGLLAKLSQQGVRIDELAPRGLAEGLLESGLLFGGQLEGLVGLGDQDGERRTLFEDIAVEL